MGQTVSCYDVVQQVAPKGNEFAGRGAAVVTGATNGIGVPTVESMLLAGFDKVFATARSEQAAKTVSDDLKTKIGADKVGERLVMVAMDLTDLASVRAAAARIDRESGDRGVSVLINNAGVMNTPYAATKDGLEMQIGTNHFGHVQLTDLLLPALERSGRLTDAAKAGDVARVVFVSSEAHKMGPGAKGFDPATFEFDAARTNYSGWSSYGQSKIANVLAALDFDTNFKSANKPIAAFSLHPGVIATGLGVHTTGFSVFRVIGAPFMKSVPQGAATNVFCALAGQALANRGGYFSDAAFTGATAKGQNAANAAELMQVTRAILDKKKATN